MRPDVAGNVFLVVALTTLLGACASSPVREMRTINIDAPTPSSCPARLPFPSQIQALPAHWHVLNVEGASYIALTPLGYENLSRTLADTQRWVGEASAQLRHYRKRED